MAARRALNALATALRPSPSFSSAPARLSGVSSQLLRPYPRLPRTLQPAQAAAARRHVFSVPKPRARSPKDETKTRKQVEPHYELTFTCVPCSERSTHTISKQGYHHGSVLITCPSCRNRHVISDHLNIFGDRKITIEDLMKERGQLVKRGTLGEDGDIEFWEDGTQTERVNRDTPNGTPALADACDSPSSQGTQPAPPSLPTTNTSGPLAGGDPRPKLSSSSPTDHTPSSRRQYHSLNEARSEEQNEESSQPLVRRVDYYGVDRESLRDLHRTMRLMAEDKGKTSGRKRSHIKPEYQSATQDGKAEDTTNESTARGDTRTRTGSRRYPDSSWAQKGPDEPLIRYQPVSVSIRDATKNHRDTVSRLPKNVIPAMGVRRYPLNYLDALSKRAGSQSDGVVPRVTLPLMAPNDSKPKVDLNIRDIGSGQPLKPFKSTVSPSDRLRQRIIKDKAKRGTSLPMGPENTICDNDGTSTRIMAGLQALDMASSGDSQPQTMDPENEKQQTLPTSYNDSKELEKWKRRS